MMIVADTSALLAFLAAEADAERIGRVLYEDDMLVSAATWTEIGIVVASKLGTDGLRRLHQLAMDLSFEITPHDLQLAQAAIDAHQRYGRGSGHPADLNFGDCFAYALAKSRNLPLLFKGNDFTHTDIVPALPSTGTA